jgi:hypothetical protein
LSGFRYRSTAQLIVGRPPAAGGSESQGHLEKILDLWRLVDLLNWGDKQNGSNNYLPFNLQVY